MSDTEQNIEQIIDEAAEWFVLIDAGDATDKDKARFAEWLNASPLHAREYAEISGLWDEAAFYGAEIIPAPAVIQLYPDTKTSSPYSDNRTAPAPDKTPFWQEWRKMAAALMVGILLSSAVAHFSGLPAPDIEVAAVQNYQTTKGESRRFRLEDGSFVQLNTDSALTVSYSDAFRELTLLQGEAFFNVAKDPQRPFIVAVDTTRVQAVGTQFNINKRREKIEVTVLEGKVRVSEETPDHPQKWLTDLVKGEQVVTRALSAPASLASQMVLQRQDHLNLRAVLSWRDNKLTFDDRDLSDVVEDFNRYNNKVLILADPTLNQIKVSGTFNPHDPKSFAQSLTRIAPVQLQTTQEQQLILSRKP